MLAAEAPADPRPAAGAPRSWWPRDRRAIALVAVVALPVLVGMAVAPTWSWFSPSDYALIELSTRDVGSHTPLVGPFSRFGWNHPGPLLYWVLAAPYRLLGSQPRGLFVGAGLVNLTAIAVSSALWFRRGRWPLLLLGSLGTALVLRSMGGFFVVDPWNPSVAVLTFLAFVLLVWSMAMGSLRAAPVVALVGSFLAETHLGYVPVVTALALVGGVGLARQIRRDRRGRDWSDERRRVAAWLGLAVVVGLLSWSGPIVEQLTREPGNLGQLVDHFRSNTDPAAGVGRALDITARHLAPTGAWLTGIEPTDVFTGDVVGLPAYWSLPLVAVFVAGIVVAARRRDEVVLWFQVLVATGLGAGVVAIARTTGETYPYLFNWMRVLSMLMLVSALWAGHRALSPAWRDRIAVPSAVVAVAAVASLSLITSVSVVRTDLPYADFSDTIEALTDPTVAAIGDTPVLMRSIGSCWDEIPMGLLLQIEKRGGVVVVPPELEHRFGPHRVYDGDNAGRQLTVGCRDAAPYEPPEDVGELVAYHGDLNPEEDARFQELADEIRAQLTAAGRDDLLDAVPTVWITALPDTGVDPELLAEYEPLVEAVQDRAAVYLGPLPSD